MSVSDIEWTDYTWNPTRGCSMAKGSELGGCLNCYAARMEARNLPGHRSPTTGEAFAILTDNGPRWTGKAELIESKLLEPLHWKKPRRIFVNSMSDLFHENLPDEAIDKVFITMTQAKQHTFQVLTKRPERMRKYFKRREHAAKEVDELGFSHAPVVLSNVWLGTSIENRAVRDTRVNALRDTPAALRFLSIEPLLEDIGVLNLDGIDWVICGGESGPGARPMHVNWVRDVRDQCIDAGVPLFFKQWGEHIPYSQASGEQIASHQDVEAFRDMPMYRVGKKAAGALLDGREYREFPRH